MIAIIISNECNRFTCANEAATALGLQNVSAEAKAFVMRPPLSDVRILLPVWGKRYIEQFLDFCLPTLLAEGNLPALCRRAACTFVLSTRTRDVEIVRSNAYWQTLERLCAVEIVAIDDLISSSHSTTITFAYADGIRSCKSERVDTCFIFLVSDYVLADGALDNVFARIAAGASGVLAGNFQMTSEGAESYLLRARGDKSCLSIKPRELIRLALDHLHPATIGNFADSPISHDARSNRLFWRVDDSTILGRFYLMHMIAIRPETADFIIAAPCDYSFIPELCPSGDVAMIEDSDEYCVVELQPRRQAAPNLRFGPLTPGALGACLGEWATLQHRKNARRSVVFHSSDIGPALPETIAKSRRFVDEVEDRLPELSQPFRYHPYWYGAIDHHERTAPSPVDFSALSRILGDPNFAATIKSARSIRLRAMLLGRPPDFRPWHPRWPDIRKLSSVFGRILDAKSIVIVSDVPAMLHQRINQLTQAAGAKRVVHIALQDIRAMIDRAVSDPEDQFDTGVLIVSNPDRENCEGAVQRIADVIRPPGRIMLVVGDFGEPSVRPFGPEALTTLLGYESHLQVEDISIVRATAGRLIVQSAMMARARAAFGGGVIRGFLVMASAAMLAIVSVGLNIRALLSRDASGQARCSSAFLTLRVPSTGNIEAGPTPFEARAPLR